MSLQTSPSTDGLFSSISGGSGVSRAGDSAPTIPLILSSALDGALNVSAPAAATATAPAATTANAGATVTPAGTNTTGAAATSSGPGSLVTDALGSVLKSVFWGPHMADNLKGLAKYGAFVVLGIGLIYVGVKTLAD